MATFWWVFWGVWILCGAISYGMYKNFARHMLMYDNDDFYTWKDELLTFVLSAFGPLNLLAGLICYWEDDVKFRLCFRMPRELCAPRQ